MAATLSRGNLARTPKLAANAAQLPTAATLAERLNLLMKRRKVKNPELARAVGVVPTTVSKWRNGKQALVGDNLERAAQYLGVSREWLRGEPVSPPPIQPRDAGFDAAFHEGVSFAIGAMSQAIADLERRARHMRLRLATLPEGIGTEPATEAERKG